MEIRRHHLIEEAKAELDVVYEEVKRAENRLFTLDRDYGERIADVQRANGARMNENVENLVVEREAQKDKIDVPSLYRLEKAALERFSILTAAFSTVCVVADADKAAEKLGGIVFRPGEFDSDSREAMLTFVRHLRAYATGDASTENDKLIRESWSFIENALRSLGRTI